MQIKKSASRVQLIYPQSGALHTQAIFFGHALYGDSSLISQVGLNLNILLADGESNQLAQIDLRFLRERFEPLVAFQNQIKPRQLIEQNLLSTLILGGRRKAGSMNSYLEFELDYV